MRSERPECPHDLTVILIISYNCRLLAKKYRESTAITHWIPLIKEEQIMKPCPQVASPCSTLRVGLSIGMICGCFEALLTVCCVCLELFLCCILWGSLQTFMIFLQLLWNLCLLSIILIPDSAAKLFFLALGSPSCWVRSCTWLPYTSVTVLLASTGVRGESSAPALLACRCGYVFQQLICILGSLHELGIPMYQPDLVLYAVSIGVRFYAARVRMLSSSSQVLCCCFMRRALFVVHSPPLPPFLHWIIDGCCQAQWHDLWPLWSNLPLTFALIG